MTQEQITFINEQLLFMGFTEYHPEELEPFTDQQTLELTQTTSYGPDTLEALLHFRYAANYGVYFFNQHTLTLHDRTQMFYLTARKGITRKEGYNMLCGRAVYKKRVSKEGAEYFAWLQLDFTQPAAQGYRLKHYYDNYGFQLAGALDQIGLLPYNNWHHTMLLRSLQRGNRQPVLLESGNAWIEANPEARRIDINPRPLPADPVATEAKPATSKRKTSRTK